jgi:nitrite reductase/ring-hydroxylating ferredoxin subunit
MADDVPVQSQAVAEAEPVNPSDDPLRRLRRKLARGLVDYARRKTMALAPGVMKENPAFFLDEGLFARERQELFRETPLVACLSNEVPVGGFLTYDYTGAPIVITRSKEGQVQAFLNVCPHRGARVVRNDCGKANRFTCRFHGWTFDAASGRAIGIPEEAQFCGEIDAQKQLIQVPCEERHGLVFVQATPGSTMDLDVHLAGFGAELDPLELDKAERVIGEDLDIRANWKYGIDTFFETYHLLSLHKETFEGLFSPVNAFETFGRHHRYTFAPLVVDKWVDMPESEWNVDLLPLQYFIFPNTVIAVGSVSQTGVTMTIHNLFPHTVGHFTSKIAVWAAGGLRSPEHRSEIETNYEKIKTAVCTEDYSVTSEAYLGLPALPAATRFPVGPHEIGLQNFHKNLHELMGV